MTQAMPTIAELFLAPEQAKKLKRFLGTWRLEGDLSVEGSPAKMAGTWSFTRAAAGWGVRGKMQAEVEGMGSYEEDDLARYDVETGTFHVYSLTNTAAVHDHIGRWTDEDTFTLEYDGLQDGKKYREEATVKFVSDHEMEIHEKDYVQGQITTLMDVTLRR